MNHLEFADKLDELGCSFRCTNIEGKTKIIEISENDLVSIKSRECSWIKKGYYQPLTALQAVIRKAIDMGEWKHSWHFLIEPANYEKFREIIQNKILERAKEIDLLTTVYFQLNSEIAKKGEEDEITHS